MPAWAPVLGPEEGVSEPPAPELVADGVLAVVVVAIAVLDVAEVEEGAGAEAEMARKFNSPGPGSWKVSEVGLVQSPSQHAHSPVDALNTTSELT